MRPAPHLLFVAALLAAAVPTARAGPASEIIGKLTAKLTGKGTGSASLSLTRRRICWRIRVGGLDKPTAAHIHRAAARKPGPVVIRLGRAFTAAGCAAAAGKTLQALVENPSPYYLDVHTRRYPTGAVRGRLMTAEA